VQRQWEGGLELAREERERAAAQREREADLNAQLAERLAKGPLEPTERETPAGPPEHEIASEGGHKLALPELPLDVTEGKTLDAEKVGEYSTLAKEVGLDQAQAQNFLDQYTHVRITERTSLPTERASVGPWLHERIGPDNVATILETYDKLPPRAQAWLDDLAQNGDARDVAAVSLALLEYGAGLHEMSAEDAKDALQAMMDDKEMSAALLNAAHPRHKEAVDSWRALGQRAHTAPKPRTKGTLASPNPDALTPEQALDREIEAAKRDPAFVNTRDPRHREVVARVHGLIQQRWGGRG
jgi:hypothetical protein